jgi:hypothetical protein
VHTYRNQLSKGTQNPVLDQVLCQGQIARTAPLLPVTSNHSLQVFQALLGVLSDLNAEKGLAVFGPVLQLGIRAPAESMMLLFAGESAGEYTLGESPLQETSTLSIVVAHGVYSLAEILRQTIFF